MGWVYSRSWDAGLITVLIKENAMSRTFPIVTRTLHTTAVRVTR